MHIDLHTHSFFSDGEYSPEEIVNEALNKNISILSITDHNFILENESIKKYARKNNIKFIEGIEISTLWRSSFFKTSLHILGYGKKLNSTLLNKKLKNTVNEYNNRAHAIINKLNKEFPNLNLDLESLKGCTKEAYISRNTLARLLVEHLKNKISIRDALRQYVFVEENDSWMMSTEESFKLITAADGVPVLAHSGKLLRQIGLKEYKEMIADLVEKGLLGIEVYYPRHTSEEINALKKIANEFNLYITGGSDWHGKSFTPGLQMGREFPMKDLSSFLSDKNINLI